MRIKNMVTKKKLREKNAELERELRRAKDELHRAKEDLGAEKIRNQLPRKGGLRKIACVECADCEYIAYETDFAPFCGHLSCGVMGCGAGDEPCERMRIVKTRPEATKNGLRESIARELMDAIGREGTEP